jgi:lysozyme
MDQAALRAQLVQDEGVRFKPYLDSKGVWTVGVGHNLTSRPLSLAVVELIFDEDLEIVLQELATLSWFTALSNIRQQVIANMAFNMGVRGVLGFHNMIAALQRHDFAATADEMLDSQWANEVGPRATRLATMMRTDQYAP